ncbi:unnamed protein product [Rotaria magnacalcarata]|uniref:NAD(P)(+)--arginine ADP-ribosyltransferase n=2 Tax=Rotaria magnacalcarata TaxID=392030 RepID=A0A816ZPH4_9BILA|nr:unnamed protein product [Rotaria magnacalcarata]CAF2224979.1 unnamed protein product [Rotaria magnacalcarata]
MATPDIRKKNPEIKLYNSDEPNVKYGLSYVKKSSLKSPSVPTTTRSMKSVSPKQSSPKNSDLNRRVSIVNSILEKPILQNFLLIWLDPNIDKSQPQYKQPLAELQRLVASINTFTRIEDCINFIDGIQETKVFMIVSGSLGQSIVPQIHDKTHVDSIYVYCRDAERHRKWSSSWSKVKDVYTKTEPILEVLEIDLKRCDQDFIAITVNGIDPSFMYSQLLKEALLETQDEDENKKTIQEFVEYCRLQDGLDESQISKLEQSYNRFSPIYWYTAPYFLYSTLNRALRVLDVDIMLKMGFFIRHLHHSIQQRYNGMNLKSSQFTVYRGQGLSKTDFEKIKKAKNGLMSFNSFLSTTNDEKVADKFSRAAFKNLENVGILFVMTITPSLCNSTPFTCINDVSFYKDKEKEILFSTHTIFRIGRIESMNHDNNRHWRVHLTLTNDSDNDLKDLTDLKRKELAGISGKSRLGQLLILLDQPLKAKKFYEILLQEAQNNVDKAYYNHQLGGVHYKMGECSQAIQYYEAALKINENRSPINYKYVAQDYQCIGAAYHRMQNLQQALSYYNKSLDIKKESLKPDHPDLISNYNSTAFLFVAMRQYDKAFMLFEKALEISENKLSKLDPQLAHSYHNMGIIHGQMGNQTEALLYLRKAYKKFKKTLPSNHTSLADLYNTMGCLYYKMSNYKKALLCFNRALPIYQATSPTDNLSVADCYANIGIIYLDTNDFSYASHFYEKAVNIYRRKHPPSHCDLLETERKLELSRKSMQHRTPHNNRKRSPT